MTSAPPHLLAIGERVDQRLERDLTAEIERWAALDALLVDPVSEVHRWFPQVGSGFVRHSVIGASLRQVAASLMPRTSTGALLGQEPRSNSPTRPRYFTTTSSMTRIPAVEPKPLSSQIRAVA